VPWTGVPDIGSKALLTRRIACQAHAGGGLRGDRVPECQLWASVDCFVRRPGKWATWVAPCPIPDSALRGVIVRQRRRKERMDDRVRQRQPLLPVLVAHLQDCYSHLRALLQAASPLAGGETVTVGGRAYQGVWTAADDRRARRGGQANTRVRDLGTGEDVNVITAEDTAFWEFAAVEVLRYAGIRIEELLELTYLSIRQYQRPNGEVIALLVIAPSKTDRERIVRCHRCHNPAAYPAGPRHPADPAPGHLL
jgi:hypothetical protein